MSEPEARTQTVSCPSIHLLNLQDTVPGSLRSEIFCHGSHILQATLAVLMFNYSPTGMFWDVGLNEA